MWIEQLWRRVFSKARASAMIIRILNDLNREIYLYGRQKNVDDDYFLHKHKPLWFVLMPDNKLKMVWNIVVMMLLMYVATYVPYKIAFIEETSTFMWWFELVIDVLFVIDIPVNFISAYEINSHLVEV